MENSNPIAPYLKPSCFSQSGSILVCEFSETPEISANQAYFNNLSWIQTYFSSCHRDPLFAERWRAAAGSWDGKIVVDIGCGPGNLFATLGGDPKLLIGVDVAKAALENSQKLGYAALLADAHNIPLNDSFADLVVVNAALHHCADMEVVLAEAARLVRAGGQLIIDHEPQLSAWNYRGLGLFFYQIRLSIIYRFFLRKLHVPLEERLSALSTEIHHQPGRGVTPNLYRKTLEPLGFDVSLYPHNNAIGAEALQGKSGPFPHWRYSVGQILSGINPWKDSSALSLMCVAVKKKNS